MTDSMKHTIVRGSLKPRKPWLSLCEELRGIFALINLIFQYYINLIFLDYSLAPAIAHALDCRFAYAIP